MGRIVKAGIVGLGVRTEVLLAAFLQMDDLEVAAVCDLKEELIEKISMDIIKELTSRTWSWGYSDYLLDHAKNIMTIIPDREIASWNVFVGED